MSRYDVFSDFAPRPLGPLVDGSGRYGCTHVAPDECPACDGTEADERELRRATPAERAEYARQSREFAALMGRFRAPAPTVDDREGAA